MLHYPGHPGLLVSFKRAQSSLIIEDCTTVISWLTLTKHKSTYAGFIPQQHKYAVRLRRGVIMSDQYVSRIHVWYLPELQNFNGLLCQISVVR